MWVKCWILTPKSSNIYLTLGSNLGPNLHHLNDFAVIIYISESLIQGPYCTCFFHLLLHSISSSSHFSNRPVMSVGALRMSFTFKKNSCWEMKTVIKELKMKTVIIVMWGCDKIHPRSSTSRTARPTPSCWRSNPTCPSTSASGRPDGADELKK